MTYTVHTLAERPELRPEVDRLSSQSWPDFLLHGDANHWHLVFEMLTSNQVLLCDSSGELLAVGHYVPLVWDGTLAR